MTSSASTKVARRDPRIRVFQVLALTAAVLTLAAILALVATRKSEAPSFAPVLLWPDFEATLDQIGEVDVETKDLKMTIRPNEQGIWGVVERGGYPVRPDILRATLWGLGDMELIEPKTARADRHKNLALVAPSDGGESVAIRVFDRAGKPMIAVLLGAAEGAETLDGELKTYVRREGEDQTWLAIGRIESEASLEEWLDLDVLDVDGNRIQRATSIPGDVSQGGETFTVERPDEITYNFRLLGLADDEEMTGPTAANGLGRALVAMTPSDVRKASDIGFDRAARVRFETFDGLLLTLAIQRFEGDYWITIAAAAQTPPAPAEPLETEAETPTSEPEDVNSEDANETTSGADVVSEADRINGRARGWAFKIPEWKGNQLTLARASLIKSATETGDQD